MNIEECAKEYYKALLKDGLIVNPENFSSFAMYYFIQGFKSYNDILEQMNKLNKDEEK